jgi:hypothetical protein
MIEHLPDLGISGIANVMSAIKFAHYYELGPRDVVMTVLTDSMEMYESRLAELGEEEGPFSAADAAAAFHRHLMGLTIDHVAELGYYDRKRVHNLKYFTWVEQQGKTADELVEQWDPEYWEGIQASVPAIDRLITAFNEATGLLVA